MNSPYLPVFESNAAISLEEMLPIVSSREVDLTAILDFCQFYRIKGICSLFMEGRPQNFILDLHKSGRAFLHYMRTAEDSNKVTSLAAPFFDALAAGDLECARDIAINSRTTWNEQEEYEEDFLYAFFLMKLFFLEGTPTDCDALLARYDSVLAGAEDVRLNVCRALFEKDSALFDDALHALLLEHEQRFKMLQSREVIAEDVAATEGQLSVGGLALVRLAELVGIETQRNYLFVPSIARKRVPVVFTQDSWRNPRA